MNEMIEDIYWWVNVVSNLTVTPGGQKDVASQQEKESVSSGRGWLWEVTNLADFRCKPEEEGQLAFAQDEELNNLTQWCQLSE